MDRLKSLMDEIIEVVFDRVEILLQKHITAVGISVNDYEQIKERCSSAIKGNYPYDYRQDYMIDGRIVVSVVFDLGNQIENMGWKIYSFDPGATGSIQAGLA